MQFELMPLFRGEPSVTVEVGDLQCGGIFPGATGPSVSPDACVLAFGRPGRVEGTAVKVSLMLDIRSYYLQMQVENQAWVPVAETVGSLQLRAHLLRELLTFWLSMQETDPVGLDAWHICQRAREEILRIEAL